MSSEVPSNVPRWARILAALGRIGILFTLLFTLASFFGRYSFWAEICTNFVNLYAIAGAVAASMLVPARRWGWVAVSVAVLLVNGARVAPLYTQQANASASSAPLTVVTANVYAANDQYDVAIEYLRSTDADVVFLQEVTQEWQERLRAGLPDYPYVFGLPREDYFGKAVFSRLPLHDVSVAYYVGHELPAITGAIKVGEQEIRFVNLHTMPPGSPYGLGLRNGQLQGAAAAIAEHDGAGFMIGDFNCAPWSPFFKDLVREHGLQDARRGFGVLGTWPSFAKPFMIPIDQCLTTPGVSVVSIERGPNLGSDHLPLQFDLRIPAR